ncbi:tyrosine-type recombinase/integrase [Sphingomonas beigongshangi]|uniref:tyrosine-type recombinase/integrase n=1 Tax=Sphingomonas beigongshangi TaxID=2782540 RepID=UPI00193B549D|nr:site-specific integrase [Sphingomonas beigongshangi]
MAVQYIRDRTKRKWFVYAYKGGPRIMTHEGPRKPNLTAEASRKLAEALAAKDAPDATRFRAVVRAWMASEAWKGLAPATRKVWQRHVDRIEAKWGDVPIGVWNDSRMTAKVVKWRDELASTPRTADIGVTVLVALLKWARLHGQGISINVAADIPNLYKGAQREEIVWLADDIARFEAAAIEEEQPWIVDGLRLCALTGLRRQDLVTLTFDHVGEVAVSKTALKKSRGKRRKANVPMTEELATFLDEMRQRTRQEGVNTVLVNSFGRPWSGDGYGGSFNRIRDKAGIVHVDEDGTERKKHLHDVRGTFCTMLIADVGLTDQEASDIMAWSKERVAQIRKTYVDDARVVVAIGERIAAHARAKREAKQ